MKKHKKVLVIAFTLASSLMSGHAMASYAGITADSGTAGSGLLSAIVSPAGGSGAVADSTAFSPVDHGGGGIYFFRENIKPEKLVQDFDKVVPMEKYTRSAQSHDVGQVTITGNNVGFAGKVWYETGKPGSQHVVQIGLDTHSSPETVPVPGIGNLVVSDHGDSGFGAAPEMGQPANDVFVDFPSLDAPSAEDDAGLLDAAPEVSWPDDGSVPAEPVSDSGEMDMVSGDAGQDAPAPDSSPAGDAPIDVVQELFPHIAGDGADAGGNADAAAQAAAEAAAQAAADAAAQQAAADAAAGAGGNGVGNGNGNGNNGVGLGNGGGNGTGNEGNGNGPPAAPPGAGGNGNGGVHH